MTAAIPDAVKQIGAEYGIALRFALAEVAPHEAAALWASGGAIEIVNEAFARAIQTERNRATEAERARCAQIADRWAHRDTGYEIAAAIRNPTGE